MSQTFSTLESGVTTFGALYGILNNNQDALRSCFSGTSFPSNPTTPQLCIRTDSSPWRIYLHTGSDVWADITDYMPDVQSVIDEVETARGEAADLTTRLDVAINQDGTLKGSAPVGDWWATEADAVAYVSTTEFTAAGDKTAIYLAQRAVYLTQTTNAYSHVVSSSYAAGADETTVTVIDAVVDSGLTAVEYGQPVVNTPLTIYQPQASTATATTTALGSVTTKHLLTGTTTITGFTGTAGVTYHCRAEGIFTLTHDATDLIITQTGASITTAAGDTFDVQMITGTTCRIVNFERASGVSTKELGTASGTVVLAQNIPTALTGGNLRNIEYFTAGDTYTKLSWLKFAIVEVVGGGGGSAGQNNDERTSPGGSGGGYARKKILAGSIGATETVTIGAGGTAGAAAVESEGGDGETTSFGTHVSATGGGGSVYGLAAGRLAAAPGTGIDGDINIDGGYGGPGGPNTISSYNGYGGSSMLGRGASPPLRGANGKDGEGYGSGASGGHRSTDVDRAGAVGKAGIVIVYEYE